MTVVAKAEFAQSYITHPQTVFFSDFKALPPLLFITASHVICVWTVSPVLKDQNLLNVKGQELKKDEH
jgi:hypothetical protein